MHISYFHEGIGRVWGRWCRSTGTGERVPHAALISRHFDFLSVGEEFGADARTTECSGRPSASAIRAAARCAG
jgi:hypothetical protein